MAAVAETRCGRQRNTILLYGPPLAGKSTILQHFAEVALLATESFEIRPAGQPFPERAYRAVNGPTVVAQTIPGAVWTIGTWDELLRSEGPILLVLDPQPSRRTVNREYVEYLGAHRSRIRAIQVTKIDIVGDQAAEAVGRSISDHYALNVTFERFEKFTQSAGLPRDEEVTLWRILTMCRSVSFSPDR